MTLLLPFAPESPLNSFLSILDDEGNARDIPDPERPSGELFRLLPFAPRRGWPIALCEASVGRAFPEYAERRRWRSMIPEPLRSGMLIFTDVAHSYYVWSWRQDLGGVDRYLEHQVPGREVTLRAALRALPTFNTSAGDPAPKALGPVAERLLAALAPDLPTRGEYSLALLLTWIEEVKTPSVVRGLWRALRRFAVLDPRCRSGVRLVGAARILEPVYLSVLERMRSFVDDAISGRHRRRPEHLRDLRTLVEQAEHPRWDSDRCRFVRRLIVQQNLFGVVPSRRVMRPTERDLLNYADPIGTPLPILDCNVRIRESRRAAIATPVLDATATSVSAPSSDGADAECLELFHTAWASIRRRRITHAAADEEFAAAAIQLGRRRDLLRRQLRSISGGEEPGLSKAHPILELATQNARESARVPAMLD